MADIGKMLDTLNAYLQTATQAELQEMYNLLKSWITVERSAEERAREHYGVFINGRCISYDDQAERCYILGASEQEAIYNKRKGELLQYLEELEAHYRDLGQYDDGKPIRRVIGYIKAMEE